MPWPQATYRILMSVFLGCAGAWRPRLSVEAVGELALAPRWGGIARERAVVGLGRGAALRKRAAGRLCLPFFDQRLLGLAARGRCSRSAA